MRDNSFCQGYLGYHCVKSVQGLYTEYLILNTLKYKPIDRTLDTTKLEIKINDSHIYQYISIENTILVTSL